MKLPIISGIWNKITGHEDITDNANVPMPINAPNFTDMDKFVGSGADAFYKAAELNIKVDSQEDILNSVWNSHLSLRCKKSWIILIRSMYDRNVLLSDLSGKHDREVAFIRSLIDKKASVLANSYPSDKNNPEFLSLDRHIMGQIWYRLTRTGGAERERIIAAFMQVKYSGNQKLITGKEKI